MIFATRYAALGECFFCQAEPILLSGEAKPCWSITKKRTSKQLDCTVFFARRPRGFCCKREPESRLQALFVLRQQSLYVQVYIYIRMYRHCGFSSASKCGSNKRWPMSQELRQVNVPISCPEEVFPACLSLPSAFWQQQAVSLVRAFLHLLTINIVNFDI